MSALELEIEQSNFILIAQIERMFGPIASKLEMDKFVEFIKMKNNVIMKYAEQMKQYHESHAFDKNITLKRTITDAKIEIDRMLGIIDPMDMN
jgi:hypothetical protein